MKLPKIYNDKNVKNILTKKVGIIGYGNQGRAQALNLYDSGIDVCIGLQNKSKSKDLVNQENLSSMPIKELVKEFEVISILIPDQNINRVFENEISPYLKKGQSIIFAHGYNIHYKIIKPPTFVDIILVAPSGPGAELRKQYIKGYGIPGLFSIYQDYSKEAHEIALSYSKAIGLTRVGLFETTFKEETETDLFGEQVLLTGGIPKLIQAAFMTLINDGYSPAVAWLVCYYEIKTIVNLFHSKGFEYMNRSISDTAEYGGITRGDRIINQKTKNEMKIILEEIKSNDFFKEWSQETDNGSKKLLELRKSEKNMLINKIGEIMLKNIS